ncbi:winged helix-turn-helix domain-containing protein [Photobacterium minamisatsumaniensis]|uniref:winged helix-turn-helix domain-containing protein n=1 Tax=Photobacterium minamisatsumaniensis TaxID=2910233 RepID=UPI003D10E210
MPHTEQSEPQTITLQTLRFSGSDLAVINTINGAKSQLRVKEAELLKLLCQKYPHVALRKDLAENIWAGTYVSDFTINQTVNGLRSKLFDLGKSLIITVPKRGYKLTTEPQYGEIDNPVIPLATDDNKQKSGILLHSNSESVDTGNAQNTNQTTTNLIRSPWLYITAFVVSVFIVTLAHWVIPEAPSGDIDRTTVLFIPTEEELPFIEKAVESEEYQYIDKVKETLYGCKEDDTCIKIAP